jgi:circadian clock protein KaiC
VLTVVQQQKIQRFFLDGLNGLEQAADYPERLGRFLTALTSELRARGVTTLFSVELRNLVGPEIDMPAVHVSAAAENIIFVRYVELHSQLYRLLSIIKVREGAYDPAIREFVISDQGIDVASTFASAEAILTGIARPLPVDQSSRPTFRSEPPE